MVFQKFFKNVLKLSFFGPRGLRGSPQNRQFRTLRLQSNATSQVINKVVVSEITVLETYGLRGVGVFLTLALPFSSRKHLNELRAFILNWNKSKYLFLAETFIATFAYLTILIALLTYKK